MSCIQTGKVIHTNMHFPQTLTNHMAYWSGVCAHKVWPRQIRYLLPLTTGDCGYEGRDKRVEIRWRERMKDFIVVSNGNESVSG